MIHNRPLSLALTNPMLPAARALTAPAARRYVVGWAGREELHVLSPAVLRARASNVPGSREMLEHGAACLYARRVVLENNRDLVNAAAPVRAWRELHWAWLLEGAARWFGGRPSTPGQRSRGGCARAGGHGSRRGSVTRRCWAGR